MSRRQAIVVPPPGPAGEPAALRGKPLFRRWLLVVSAGEFIGFSIPACAGALTAEAPAGVGFGVILAAGAVEGTVLGLAQASVLRRAVPGLPVRRWAGATAAGAVLAYVIGMLPSSLSDRWSGLPAAVLILAAAVLGTALLASIGTAQWLVLRRVLARRTTSWIVTTAVAWLLGLAAFLGFATPLWQPGQSLALVVAIGVAGGLIMAVVTSAVTGVAVRRLVASAAPVHRGGSGAGTVIRTEGPGQIGPVDLPPEG